MAQHDYAIANQGFPAFRSDLNDALAAIVSNNSGATEPTTMFAHQMWVDTAADPSVLKIRNADNDAWITIGTIDQTNDRFILSPAGGSAAAPAVSGSGDLDTGLFFPGSNVLGFATNGTEAGRFNASGNLAFPNGQGIDFSASAGGGASSSILDDYEEGTWTPTAFDAFSGGNEATYGADTTGTYTKIGNMVYWRFTLNLATKGSMTAGNVLYVRGFPFTSASISGNWYNPASVILRGVTYTGFASFHQIGNSITGYLYETVSNANGDSLPVSDYTSTASISASGFYRV